MTLHSDEESELYLEYYKEEVYEYFNISNRNDLFDLKHISNDAVCNIPIDLFKVKVNVIK